MMSQRPLCVFFLCTLFSSVESLLAALGAVFTAVSRFVLVCVQQKTTTSRGETLHVRVFSRTTACIYAVR